MIENENSLTGYISSGATITASMISQKGAKGDPGRGITSITLTSTVGKVKTYTITFTDNTTTTFQVTDGTDGVIGADGKSLEFNWNGTQLGIRVEGTSEYTYVDLKGATGANGQDGDDGRGIVSITRTSGTGAAGTTDTYTITYTDSTTSTFNVYNGSNGANGTDGVSPTITTSKVGKVTTLTITDAQGTHTATINDGADGSGSGDMLKATYDTNENGVVDNAEKVNNHTVNADVPSNAVFTDTTYTAGTNISISANNEISATDTTYTAGTGISITDNVISNTQTSAEWGNITGTLSSQTDLNNALGGKQATLVSGTNIKTINSTSILGSGDLEVLAESLPINTILEYDGVTAPEGFIEATDSDIATKSFVNSSIATNTAYFRGTSASGLTEAQFLSWANSLTKTNNDYVFWNTTDSNGNVIYKRYKYNGSTWVYEYTLNNSSFTAAQWESIQSGITSSLVTQIGTNQTNIANKQDILTAGTNITIANNVISATGGTTYTAGDGINITDNEISAKVGTGIFFNSNDEISLNAATQNTLAQVSQKQDTLVSGTNIKTINSNSILGSGNIEIQGGGDTLPIGSIVPYGNATAPSNWLICDGSAVSRTTYSELFSIIGTSYGSGNGSTTFNLPDLRGRVAVGKSTDTEFDTLGETGGEKTHTLTVNEIPSHTHGVNTVVNGENPGATYYRFQTSNYQWGGSGVITNVDNAGGGQAHNNLQPYQVVNYIIKAQHTAYVGDDVTVQTSYSSSNSDTYSCNYVNEAIKDTYSTTEQVVGTWINGKPIYRRVFSGTYNHGATLISNVATMVNAYGEGDPGTGIARQIPYFEIWNNKVFSCKIQKYGTDLQLDSYLEGNSHSATLKITIEYTKTTD